MGGVCRVRVVAAALAALFLLAPAGTGETGSAPSAAGALGWKAVGSAPFRLSFLRDGRTVVAQATPAGPAGPGHRLSYRLADGSFHSLTRLLGSRPIRDGTLYRVATDERRRFARVTVRRIPGGVRVSLELVPATGVREVFESFAGPPAEHFLGTGERPAWVDLRGQIVPLKVFSACRSSLVVPFYLSSAGYGVRLRSSSLGMIVFPGAAQGPPYYCFLGSWPCAFNRDLPVTQVCLAASRLEYDVYAGTPAEIVRAHAATSGRPALPPPSQLALMKWRDVVRGPADLLDDVHQLQRRDIPLGWVILDNPWEEGAYGTGCYGLLRFDSRFPDPKGMIDEIHRRGVRFMLWVSPQIRRKAGCPAPPYAAGEVVTGQSAFLVDLTKPEARAAFERRLRALVALGVDGFKGDRADEVDLQGKRLAGGPGSELHNRIPLLYAQAITSVLRSARGRDFATLSRAAFAGSQRVLPGVVGPDLPHDFRGLAEAVRMAQNAGVSGFPIWGSDIGGYSGDTAVTSEVLVRWAQFGALTPIFEIGGQGLTAQFWKLGEPTVDLFRRAAILHYELFPYLYDLARNAHRSGEPIVRPLGYAYPGDGRAWQSDLQFLVGPSLLAAPVTSGTLSGNRVGGPPAQARVYLPAGRWLDAFTGASYSGGRTIVRPTPLAELPLYVAAGAALPVNLREPQVWASPWRTNDLDRRGRAGWVYAPAPRETATQSATAGTLRGALHGRRVTIRLSHARRESQLLVLSRSRACAVRVDGVPLPESTPEALRSLASGWTFRTSTPFPGVMVKRTGPPEGAVTVDLCE